MYKFVQKKRHRNLQFITFSYIIKAGGVSIMNKKNVIKLFSLLLICILLPIRIYAEESENPAGADEYYNARTNKETVIGEEDLSTVIKTVPQNTPVHLTGNTKSTKGRTGTEENGKAIYGTIYFVEVELKDGTIGYARKDCIDVEKAQLTMYVKKDTYLLSQPDNKTEMDIALLEGEMVTVVGISGDYSQIECQKKAGWVQSSILTKLEPKYLYCTKKTKYYYNDELEEEQMSGTAILGKRGVISVGTKVEYITTTEKDGFKDIVYLIVTPTKEWAYVDASCFSFKVPTTLYTNSNTKLYKTATKGSKAIVNVKMGTKVTRLFTQGSFYKVKLANGKIGYIPKNKLSTQKIKPVKKNYGTYYLTSIYWDNDVTYPPGTKVIQIDPYYYEFNDEAKKSKTHKDPYDLVKVQLPNGKVKGVYIRRDDGTADALKSKKKALTHQKDFTEHAKKVEKKIFKQFNAYRKENGLQELKWDQTAYKYADSYFNYCVMVGETDFPHSHNSHGWYGLYDDIILTSIAGSIEDAAKVSEEGAMDAWKESPLHDQMLLQDDYLGAAVAVMYNATCNKMETVIMCTKVKTPYKFTPKDDNYMAKTWYSFLYDNPKFTDKRGDEYEGRTW